MDRYYAQEAAASSEGEETIKGVIGSKGKARGIVRERNCAYSSSRANDLRRLQWLWIGCGCESSCARQSSEKSVCAGVFVRRSGLDRGIELI